MKAGSTWLRERIRSLKADAPPWWVWVIAPVGLVAAVMMVRRAARKRKILSGIDEPTPNV